MTCESRIRDGFDLLDELSNGRMRFNMISADGSVWMTNGASDESIVFCKPSKRHPISVVSNTCHLWITTLSKSADSCSAATDCCS